jgi:fumarylpyruvate hydrolase
MTGFVFAPAIPSLPVAGRAECYAVRRIWCVGSNYRKPGVDYANRAPAYFFSKQPDMLVPDGGAVRYPALAGELRFEVELVVAMGPDGIFGHAVGLDMTIRDLLLTAQAANKPWEVGKSFEESAPCGMITPGADPMLTATMRLTRNGEIRQDSDIAQMIWNVPEIIAALSRRFPSRLREGRRGPRLMLSQGCPATG